MEPLDLEDVDHILRSALRSYKTREDFEDGIQEGMIRAWKDMEAGGYERQHIINRAAQWARAFYQDAPKGRKKATGAPRKDLSGVRDQAFEKRLEKVSQWMSEYMTIHDAKPKQFEIAKGVGLSDQTVSSCLKAIAEGYQYRIRGRTADSVSVVSYENTMNDDGVSSEVRRAAVASTDYDGHLEAMEVLRLTTPVRARCIAMVHLYGWTQEEAGSLFGVSQMSVSRAIQDGISDIRRRSGLNSVVQ